MRRSDLLLVSRTLINELLTDITNFVQTYHNDKNNPDSDKMYYSIKERIQRMSNVLFSYNLVPINPRKTITDPNDPKYDPIAVFNNIIIPIYKIGGFIGEFKPVNDEAINKQRSIIMDKLGLTSTDMVLELYPKWSKRITLEYHYGYTHPENGDASFPIKGLSGNLQRMLFSRYISSVFPKGDVYTYTYRDDYERKYVEMHLALRDSSDILSDEEEWYLDDEDDDSISDPYLRYIDNVPTRLGDAVYAILKNTKTTIIVNRYTLPF